MSREGKDVQTREQAFLETRQASQAFCPSITTQACFLTAQPSHEGLAMEAALSARTFHLSQYVTSHKFLYGTQPVTSQLSKTRLGRSLSLQRGVLSWLRIRKCLIAPKSIQATRLRRPYGIFRRAYGEPRTTVGEHKASERGKLL